MPTKHRAQLEATMSARQGCDTRGCYVRTLDRLAKPSPTVEAEGYVTLVYGDGPFVCSAAVIGANLAAIDPSRPRLAMVAGIRSAETRAILSASSWRLMDVEDLIPDIADVKGVPMRPFSRKLPILAAPFSRALFLDADQVLVQSNRSRARLENMWAQQPQTDMLAKTDTKDGTNATCFNSGLLLYRPSRARAVEYAKLLERAAAHGQGALAFRDALPAFRICGGYDQPFINEIYAKSWKLLPHKIWRALTTQKVMSNTGICYSCAHHVRRNWDSFHFFSRFFPWGGDCGPCVLAGGHCHYESMKSVLGNAGKCPAHYALQELFWAQFDQLLPRGVAKHCLPLMSAPTAKRVCYDRMRRPRDNQTYCPATFPIVVQRNRTSGVVSCDRSGFQGLAGQRCA